MRGSWIARLYQPIGVVMIAYLGRLYAAAGLLPRRLRLASVGALGLALALNLWVALRPSSPPSWAARC